MTRTRTGRRIELSPRDIKLFRLLTHYRYLRSTYLYAFVGGASETRFKERLGDLFHEGYLGRPAQQWVFADARYRPAVHEIAKRGRDALRDCGVGPHEEEGCGAQKSERQFLHSLMICETLASIELAARATPHRFIGWSEILARASVETRASAFPRRLPLSSGSFLMPDGVCGIEYRSGESKSYRFFALEADRGTMPLTRTRPDQTSYIGKLASYAEILDRRTYKAYWGVPNLLVLTLTTSAARVADIVAKVDTSYPAFLFKAVEGRALIAPLPGLLCEPWERAGHPPLSIHEGF